MTDVPSPSQSPKLLSIAKDEPRRSKVGWYVAGGLFVAAVGYVAFEMKTTLNDAAFNRLESGIVDSKERLSNYDQVREFVRAKREGRRPDLSPDQFDSAKTTANELAKRYKVELEF